MFEHAGSLHQKGDLDAPYYVVSGVGVRGRMALRRGLAVAYAVVSSKSMRDQAILPDREVRAWVVGLAELQAVLSASLSEGTVSESGGIWVL